MILLALFSWVVTVVSWVLSLIPSGSSLGLPDTSSWVNAIADNRIWRYFGWANWYFPLDLAVALLAVRLAVWLALYGFEFATWALVKLHILGGDA